MAKKRKATPQSATLLDFFGQCSNAPAQKKAKPQPDARHTKEKRGKDVQHIVLAEDIIVIDDEDVVIDLTSSPLAGSSKQGSLGSKTNSEGREARSKRLHALSGLDVLHVKRENHSPSEDLYENVENYFGPPSSLLLPGGSELPSTRARSPSFGMPSMLLPSSTTMSSPAVCQAHFPNSGLQAGLLVPPIPPSPQLASGEVGRETKELPDEEWATGDDELDLGDPDLTTELEEEDAVDIDLTLDDDEPSPVQVEDNVTSCPLCDTKLRGLNDLDVQKHVNNCIDSMVDSTSTHESNTKTVLNPPTSTPKPLRPLSSISIPRTPPIKQEPVEQPSRGDTGVFSKLMTSHKENEAWKEASAAEDRNFRPTKGNGGRRKAPFYKVMQGMPIAVDAFRYGTIPGVTAYFLTHAHSDHYTNLSNNWKSGPIYCSEGTANLIVHMLGVGREWVHPLPMDVATTIPDSGGVRVTLIEANHCPGSCLFLFEGPQTVDAGDSAFKSPSVGSSKTFRYLHCGDFRASPQHILHPAIKGKRIDHVYLDTTYLDPKYCFPPQPQVISACAELARRIVQGESLHDADAIAKGRQNKTMDSWLTTPDKPRENLKDSKQGKVLVVVGTYSIGKERIVKAIARALQTKVYCDSRKAAILRCQADPELDALLTKDPLEGGIHLVPLGVIASDRLKDYVERFKGHYSKAVGFRPTGWTFSAPTGSDMIPSVSTIISRSQSRTFTYAQMNPMKNSTATLQVYGVPYSEHSSFFELTCFALSLDWGKMIATVNVGSENSRRKMGKWIERWEAEKKKRAKAEVVGYRAQDYW